MLVDTHCHLDQNYFPEGAEAVLERARLAEVGHAVVIGVGAGPEAAEHAVALAEARPDVSAAVGMHPHDADAFDEPMYEVLDRLCEHPQVVALGEIGAFRLQDVQTRSGMTPLAEA